MWVFKLQLKASSLVDNFIIQVYFPSAHSITENNKVSYQNKNFDLIHPNPAKN